MFNFRLSTLFYLTTLYGVSFFFGAGTVICTTWVVFGWAMFMPKEQPTCGIFVSWLLGGLVVIPSLLPQMVTPREITKRTECRNNIRQLSLGVWNYESAKQHFPPAYTVDSNGAPAHSWRVLILPYLGYASLYEKYDFEQPWDGPENLKLLSEMPIEFRCPSHLHVGKTTYKLVTGKNTAFDRDQTSGFLDITDGSSNSLLIVEDYARPVEWTRPSDLSVADVVEIVRRSAQVQRAACCAHGVDTKFNKAVLGTQVSLIDGSTHSIGPCLDTHNIESLCTINDGDPLSIDELNDHCVDAGFVKLDAWFLLVAYLVLLVLPVCRWVGRFRQRPVSEKATV